MCGVGALRSWVFNHPNTQRSASRGDCQIERTSFRIDASKMILIRKERHRLHQSRVIDASMSILLLLAALSSCL